jgi:hypothetical protein
MMLYDRALDVFEVEAKAEAKVEADKATQAHADPNPDPNPTRNRPLAQILTLANLTRRRCRRRRHMRISSWTVLMCLASRPAVGLRRRRCSSSKP